MIYIKRDYMSGQDSEINFIVCNFLLISGIIIFQLKNSSVEKFYKNKLFMLNIFTMWAYNTIQCFVGEAVFFYDFLLKDVNKNIFFLSYSKFIINLIRFQEI